MTHAIAHLSEQPWSNYTAADYSIEQWHAACLIHQHEGPPTSKSQCKLPVKTPTGAVNKNGVHAAAAALAGARGGVHASSEEKAKAARAIRGYYNQMGEKPPPSLMEHANVISFIEHHGTKGMRWGVRRSRSDRRKAAKKQSSESKTVAELKKRKPSQLTNKQLQKVNTRMNLEQNFTRMNPSTIKKGTAVATSILATLGVAVTAYNMAQSPAGKAAIRKGQKLLKIVPKGQLKFPI